MATPHTSPPNATPSGAAAPRVVLDEAFLARLERIHYLTRLVVSGGMRGEKRSKRHGSSIDFADYRQYSKGDDLRRVDWKVFARTDRYYTKLFYEEEDLTVHVLIDSSASMSAGDGAKFRYAQQVSAALGYVALANMERVRYRAFADRLFPEDTGYMRSKSAVTKAFRFLEDLHPVPGAATDLLRSCQTFAVQNKSRGLVILVSDFLVPEGIFEGIKRLLHQGNQVCCFQILDPLEMEPAVRGELRLVDVETGDAREVTISPRLLRMYRTYRDAFLEHMETTCRRLGVSYYRALTTTPLEEAVLKGLAETRLLGRGSG